TAPIWLAKREKLRDSRNARNEGCLSRAPAPTGIREDMAKPVSCFSKREPWPATLPLLLITPWLSPEALSMAWADALPGIALAGPPAIIPEGVWDHAAIAIGVRRAGVAGDRVGARRKPPRGVVAANGDRACGHHCHRTG